MADEIYAELKKRYDTVRLVLAAKWLANEMDGNQSEEEETYDVPLLTIYFKDLSEEPSIENRLLQVRVRNIYENQEELVLVFHSRGASKVVTDIDSALTEVSGYIEDFTGRFLLEFPDAIYRYEWYGGDEETIKPEE